MLRKVVPVIALVSGIASMAPQVHAQILANSVASFSSAQGQNNWYYGYYDKTDDADKIYNPVSDFHLMSQYETNGGSLALYAGGLAWYVDDGQVFTSLWADGGHGNGLVTSGGRQEVEEFAIRRWVSDYSGEVAISGSIAKLDSSASSNGISAYITVNGTTVFAEHIGGQDTAGVNYSLDIPVTDGDSVDFWIDPYMANDLGDSSKFTASIVGVTAASAPEPASLTILCVGLSYVVGYGSRNRKRLKALAE